MRSFVLGNQQNRRNSSRNEVNEVCLDKPLLDLYLENVLPVRKSLFIEQSICSLNQFVRRCEIVLIKISVSNEDCFSILDGVGGKLVVAKDSLEAAVT